MLLPAAFPFEVIEPGSSLYLARMLKPGSEDEILRALQKDPVARRILAKCQAPSVGSVVGVRLNLNIFKLTGITVHTIHQGGTADAHCKGRGLYRNPVIDYRNVVVLRDAYFNVGQREREVIASGQAKSPMASIDGTLQPIGLEGASFDGLEISFNPTRTHLFIDSRGFAVRYAQDVTVLGHRAYARGRVEFFTAALAPKRAGSALSVAKFYDGHCPQATSGRRAASLAAVRMGGARQDTLWEVSPME